MEINICEIIASWKLNIANPYLNPMITVSRGLRFKYKAKKVNLSLRLEEILTMPGFWPLSKGLALNLIKISEGMRLN